MNTTRDNSPNRANYFLIERLSPLLLILSLGLRCLGWIIYYANLSPLLRFHCLRSFIKRVGLHPLDLGEIEELEADKVFNDSLHLIPTAMNEFTKYSEIFPLVEEVFSGVKEGGESLKAAMYAQAGRRYHIVYYFLLLLRSIPTAPRFVLTYIYRDAYVSKYLRHIEAPVFNIAPSLWLIKLWECAVRTLKGAPLNIYRRFSLQYPSNKIEYAAVQSSKKYKILYFSHQSIFYGRLFAKDHFYSKEKNALLHPSNILHVEFRPSSCPKEHLKKQREMNLETHTLNAPGLKIIFFSAVEFLNFSWKHRTQLLRTSALRSMSLQFIALFIEFKNYSKEISSISKDARVALVGYDMLLPTGLALALNSLGIQTIATQERFYSAFQALYCSFILDNYIVASSFIKERFISLPNVFVKNIIPAGMVRTDLLHHYSSNNGDALFSETPQTIIVTALDFPSGKSIDAQRLCLANNWKANKNFYFDIIKLATIFKALHITIRGKDDAWFNLEYFQDVKQVIQSLPNVEVSHEYETLNESYLLCVNSDLIIAKHTSLADECIAVGKQVLIHDYTHNSRKLLSNSFDYFDAPFFCHSFEELQRGVQRYLDTGRVMDPEKYAAIRDRVFEGRADGKVRQRVQQTVLDILQGGSAVGDADA